MNIKKAKGIFFRVRSLEFLLFAWKNVKKKKKYVLSLSFVLLEIRFVSSPFDIIDMIDKSYQFSFEKNLFNER